MSANEHVHVRVLSENSFANDSVAKVSIVFFLQNHLDERYNMYEQHIYQFVTRISDLKGRPFTLKNNLNFPLCLRIGTTCIYFDF